MAERLLDPTVVDDFLWRLLQSTKTHISRKDYTVEDVPSVTFHPAERERAQPSLTPQEVFSVVSPNATAAEAFRKAALVVISRSESPLISIGADAATRVADFSVPVAADAALFGRSTMRAA